MTTTRSKKYLISFGSLFTIGIVYTIILACGGGYYWEDESEYQSFFKSNLLDKQTTFFGKDESFAMYNNINTFDDINVEEWEQYFEYKISKETISKLLYQISSEEIEKIAPTMPYLITTTNREVQQILQQFDKANPTKTKNFLEYLQYAKKCEPLATYHIDYWYSDGSDSTSPYNDITKYTVELENGKKILKKCKDSFICERYIFQIIRLQFLLQEYNQCIEFFNKHKTFFIQNSNMYWRSLGYVAGAYYKSGYFSQANYLYSLIFDQNKTMQNTAYLSFKPLEENDWAATLNLAQTPHQKIILWHMFSLYTKDFERALREIYAQNTASPILEGILLNAINSEEKYHITANSIQPFSKELQKLITKIAQAKNTSNQSLWNMAAGYVNTVNGDLLQASIFLNKVLTENTKDSIQINQVRLITIIGTLLQTKEITTEFETDFTQDFEWLQNKHNLQNQTNRNVFLWTKSFLADLYKKNKDNIKSECLVSTQNYYNTYQSIDELLAFLQKQNKSKFEQLLANCYSYTQQDLYGLQSFLQMFTYNNMQQSLEKQKLSYDYTLPADPFSMRIKDCHDCDFEENHTNYTQISFIERIIQLQKQVQANPQNSSQELLELGNAYYNISYYGNSRAMYQNNILYYNQAWNWGNYYYSYSSYDSDNTFIFYTPVDCSIAKEYYIKAMQTSKNKEFKAKCCYLAAKCEYTEDVNAGKISFEKAFIPGVYFEMLKNEYKKTQYYQEILNECGYFKTYIDSKK